MTSATATARAGAGLNAEQASRVCNTTSQILACWAFEGRLPYGCAEDGQHRYPAAGVRELLARTPLRERVLHLPSSADVAGLFEVAHSRVSSWSRRGWIQAVRTPNIPGRQLFFTAHQVQVLLHRRLYPIGTRVRLLAWRGRPVSTVVSQQLPHLGGPVYLLVQGGDRLVQEVPAYLVERAGLVEDAPRPQLRPAS